MKPLQYTVFAGLLLAGVAAGFLQEPDASELGLLYFKAHQDDEARRILESRLAAGELSIDVTIPWPIFIFNRAMWTALWNC
jgi:hypothetical protein